MTEYISGDKKEILKLNHIIKKVQNNFDKLIIMEKAKKPIEDVKNRDSKAILENLLSLEQQWQDLKKHTYKSIKSEYIAGSIGDIQYDKEYNKLLNNLLLFEKRLDNTFIKVLKDFNEYRDKVYLFMIALFITISSFFYIVMRRVLRQLKQIEDQDKMIEQQSKMAAMGEMIDSIAHQWKQPLGIIKMKIMMLELDIKDDNLNKNDTQNFVNSSMNQIEHLLNTMEEFRAFFRPNDELEDIQIQEIIDSSLMLMEDDLVKNNISTKIVGDTQASIFVNPNEFKHVIINIVNNTKDAYIEKNIAIENRDITFGVLQHKNSVELLISDHAGGIKSDIIQNIFQANFTTKEDGKGTGIGLYMTKQIILKHHGTIIAQNIDNGVVFKINIPIIDN
jgi:signal transduction histidine kinase